MGFGGAAQAMITSLKNNEMMRSKRTKFKKTIGGNNSNEKTEYNFPEATPEMLKKLRERLLKERNRKNIQLAILMVVFSLGLFIFIIKVIN